MTYVEDSFPAIIVDLGLRNQVPIPPVLDVKELTDPIEETPLIPDILPVSLLLPGKSLRLPLVLRIDALKQ